MFIKNVFRNKLKKINKNHANQVKQILSKPEFILFNFSENIYLPEEQPNEEIIHCSCEKTCNLLRKIRDNPEIFTDYLKKYNFTKPKGLCDDSLKLYIDKKIKATKTQISKLTVDENINNIKIISSRMKNSFIICESNDVALKTFDNKNAFIFLEFKDEINYKIVDKIKNASVVIMTNNKQLTELKKRNYRAIGNNLFIKN